MARPFRIFVAEDDPTDQFLVECALKRTQVDFQARYVRNGAEAIEYLEHVPAEGKPDLLLLDLNMPILDGFGVLEWLRTRPDLGTMRVVILSNLLGTADICHAGSLGARGYIVKPSDPADLVFMLKELEREWRQQPAIPLCA
jgi:two-component system response regulator